MNNAGQGMAMKPNLKQRTFIVCPGCGVGEHDITRQIAAVHDNGDPGAFGWWLCPIDECGTEIQGTAFSDGSADIEHRDNGRGPQGLALMTMGGRYFVIKQKYGRVQNPDYFYHSHQCPTNLLRNVTDVFDPEHGKDPHGILRYVASIDRNAETARGLEDASSLAELLSLFKTDGQPAESQWWPEQDGGMLDFVAYWQRDGRKQGDA